ncbi:LysR family transcriptional regulator, glycine cleavage system transcriptional activator [Pseudomonas sp. NFACC23-1]|uniref:transcriptional regulator GcvA n=1 Tax=unclassified Pseudomonas TaxID=196821 RepID=UPI0008911489|nr:MULTISPECIES: transcriptional regulator GcvA [unclassified Pseudomonas]SDB33438.1 LysR family transcriptional regulator, glycine cleavage system transcriptional activator [Pseudomonas sp. NFACC17-2]SEJ50041.1 LysR family transcriptional regulator, glycine cleavage system transcriptional activator [Pseudomonas sp. NFACC23-1]SFW70075.1 LysR family transcriptional regulator, glycine cleavage system transcriptional activator [Pseudomonas sp. NFACC16-2]
MIANLPPLNAVRAFAAAARHQSFSRAAEELHVSHSAVSRHVKLLEERLGVLLFERRTRQSLLTPEGKAFYEQVSEALTQIANAAAALTRRASQRKVIINVRPSFAVRWLIPRLPDFVALHPDIKPEVVTSTRPPDPSREPFDVVIRRGRAGWSPHVQPTVLLEDDLLLVAAPSLLQSVPLESMHDLARHTLLSGRTRSSDWQDWAEHAGIEPLNNLPTLQFDHMHLVLQAAVDGLGVALCPASLLGKDLSNGRLTCPLPSLRLPLSRYYYGVSRDAAVDAQLFVDWLFSQIRQPATAQPKA